MVIDKIWKHIKYTSEFSDPEAKDLQIVYPGISHWLLPGMCDAASKMYPGEMPHTSESTSPE